MASNTGGQIHGLNDASDGSMNFTLPYPVQDSAGNSSHSQQGIQEDDSRQQELNFGGCIPWQDTAGNPSPVVYTVDGMVMSKREAIREIEAELFKVRSLAEREKDDFMSQIKILEDEIKRLETEKIAVEQQLVDVTSQLTKSIEDGHAKDEQLKKEVEAKDEKLRLRESELAKKLQTITAELNEKLAAKESELNDMLKLQQQKNELEKELNEKKTELKAQMEVTETLKREKEINELKLKHELEMSGLQIKMRDQQLTFSKERQQMKDRQHQLELQAAGVSKNDAPVSEDSDGLRIAGPKVKFWYKKVLGRGAFGKVYEGLYDGNPCAVKILNEVAMELASDLPAGPSADDEILQKAIDSFIKEGECLKQVDHQNVVKLYDFCTYPKGNYPVIAMEKLSCSLTCFFMSPGGQDISLLVQLSLTCDVASALEYLHRNKIIHRDLRGDNILLNTQTPNGMPVAKVSDFGMSRILKNFERMSAKLTSIIGHPPCYPPELLEDPSSYDMSIDIFMFGVVMLQIAHKISCVESQKHRRELINELSESHALKKYIQRCVEVEKKKRPEAEEVHTELKKMYENLQCKDQVPHSC